jgi:hypothetical protein
VSGARSDNIELLASSAGALRTVTLLIMDASDTSFTVNTFGLSNGKWDPDYQPQLAQALDPGKTLTYKNFTDVPYSGVGGAVSLAALSGGLLNITWTWNYGSPLQSGFVVQATSLHYVLVVGGQNTPNPTVQVSISSYGLAKAEELLETDD